ncbi:MAG: MauE/DoxX family redox-associated membrane protein [Bacteroidota bacterium]
MKGMLLQTFLGLVFIVSKRALARALEFSLGGLFTVSGIAKLLDPYSFSVVVGSYGILPKFLVVPVSILIPLLEFLLGAMLLLEFHVRLASLWLGAMVVLLTVVHFFGYKGGDASGCGCFVKLIQRSSDVALILENVGVVVGLCIIVVLTTRRKEVT